MLLRILSNNDLSFIIFCRLLLGVLIKMNASVAHPDPHFYNWLLFRLQRLHEWRIKNVHTLYYRRLSGASEKISGSFFI